MNEAQIKHMVDRFLTWQLPDDFAPDGGIEFERVGNAGSPYEYKRAPVGTNLLTYAQAEKMVRNMIDGLPKSDIGQMREDFRRIEMLASQHCPVDNSKV